MAAKFWIKLYHEILHDPKMARMPDHLWRRTIELFLLAGEQDDGGTLPDAVDIAWILRIDESQLETELKQLEQFGILSRSEDRGWYVTKFEERQNANPPAERMRKLRDRKQKQQYYRDEQVTVIGEVSYDPVTCRNVDKIRIDKIREEEGAKNAPSPASPSAIFSENISAEHLFEQVTGFTAIPGDHREDDLGKLQSILTKHKARAPAYLAPYWQEWLKRRYRKTNTGWLDWAIVGEIPPTKGDPSNDWKQGYSSA